MHVLEALFRSRTAGPSLPERELQAKVATHRQCTSEPPGATKEPSRSIFLGPMAPRDAQEREEGTRTADGTRYPRV